MMFGEKIIMRLFSKLNMDMKFRLLRQKKSGWKLLIGNLLIINNLYYSVIKLLISKVMRFH